MLDGFDLLPAVGQPAHLVEHRCIDLELLASDLGGDGAATLSGRLRGLPAEGLDRAVAEKVVPGAVAVVGDREGVLYEGAFGRLNVDGDVSARPDTMVWIASMTKAIVSVAALQLIEQGHLELEGAHLRVGVCAARCCEPAVQRRG